MKFGKLPDALIMLACVLVIAHIGIERYRKNMGHLPPAPYQTGSKIEDTDDLKLRKAGRTLLLATASTCHFCTASMPFYRRLLPVAAKAGVRVVAVTTEEPAVNQMYLASHNVEIASAVSSITNHIKISSTPILILLESNGTVVSSWLGKLNSDQEDEVLNAVGAPFQNQ
jgi:hypothetical protein